MSQSWGSLRREGVVRERVVEKKIVIKEIHMPSGSSPSASEGVADWDSSEDEEKIGHLSQKREAGRPFRLRPTHTRTVGVLKAEGLSVLPHSCRVPPAFSCGTCGFMRFSHICSGSELRARACWLKLIQNGGNFFWSRLNGVF